MLHRNRTRGSFHTRDELFWERRREQNEAIVSESKLTSEINKMRELREMREISINQSIKIYFLSNNN